MKKFGAIVLVTAAVYWWFSLPSETSQILAVTPLIDEAEAEAEGQAKQEYGLDGGIESLSESISADSDFFKAGRFTGARGESASRPTDGSLDEKEVFHRRNLASHPDSPTAMRDYARFLVEQSRYAEALTLLRNALRLDPKPAWTEYQNEVEKFVEEQEAGVGLGFAPFAPIESVSFESDLTPEQTKEAEKKIEADTVSFKEKYRNELATPQYESPTSEVEALRLAQDYEYAKLAEDAGQQYERLQREFPQSPRVFGSYVRFLVSSDRFEEAATLVRLSKEKFPSDVRLRVMEDVLLASQPSNLEAAVEINYRMGLLGLDISSQ